MSIKMLKGVTLAGTIACVAVSSAIAGHGYDFDDVIARGFVKNTTGSPVTLHSVSPNCHIQTSVPKQAVGDLPETVFYRIVWKGHHSDYGKNYVCNLKFSSANGGCMASYMFNGSELQNVDIVSGKCGQATDQLPLAKRVDILF